MQDASSGAVRRRQLTASRRCRMRAPRSSRRRCVRFLAPRGDERALDSGSGAGALAFALAPHVREVVAVDLVPELLEQGRKRAEPFPNVSFVEGDATALPFEPGSFDLAGALRTLHHVARPELAVAELARVTRPGGRVLVDRPDRAGRPGRRGRAERFERARDPSHTRALADIDLRRLFESNGLVLLRERVRARAARARRLPRPGRLRGRGSRARGGPRPAELHRRARLVSEKR